MRDFALKYLKGENKGQTIILFAVASLFMPYVLSAVVLLFVCVRALVIKNVRTAIFKDADFKLLLLFFALNFIPPLFFRNYLGFACFFGVNAMLIFSLYSRKYITENLTEKIFDVVSLMSISCAAVSTFIKASEHGYRSPSVFFNPNYYGTMITFIILICFFRLLKRNGNALFNIVTILANVYGLLMADCQSAFFAIGFGAVLMLLLTRHFKTFALFLCMGIVGIIFLPYLTFIMPRIGGALSNIALRSEIWKAGFMAFCENAFLGRGMMGYLQIYSEFGGPKNFHCHNLFIDMLLSFGIVGSIPLVTFVSKNLVKCAKSKAFMPLLMSVFAALMLHSLVDVTVSWIQTGGFAAFLLSTAFAEKTEKPR